VHQMSYINSPNSHFSKGLGSPSREELEKINL
jgi:hypothetical protein